MDDQENPEPATTETHIEHLAERLRQVAERSAGNRAAVMQGIKVDYAVYGFSSADAMAKYIFRQRTRR